MGDETAAFEREDEVLRRLVIPLLIVLRALEGIERAVDLDRVEFGGGVFQLALLGQALRIKRPAPWAVAPAGDADADLCHLRRHSSAPARGGRQDSAIMPLMLKKILAALLVLASIAQAQEKTVEIRADVLEDKIRGGMLGQILGNLNGLPHEMKYIAEAGKVEKYVPSLPEGARTDDDTDIEWVYLLE